jgi:nucleoside-diphosphate-sugar epimerase
MSAKNAHDACTAFKGQCRRFIFTSTGPVYNPVEGLEIKEGDYDQNTT